MLAELREERERIEKAMFTLERLARSRGQRRGRPPSWLKEVGDSELDNGEGRQPNAVMHTGGRRRPGRPRGSKERSAQALEAGSKH
jgi:hypothetical protein